MADKPTDDPTFKDKQKQTQQRKQRGGLAAAFLAVSLLVPSGWYGADRYIFGADNFEHAVTQSDYDTAQKYVARLGDEDMARFFRQAASTGDMTLFNMLLAQDDDNHYGYGVANDIKNDIATLAAQGGHTEILRYMRHSSNIGFFNEDALFVELARSGEAVGAINLYRAMNVHNVWIEDAINAAITAQDYETAAEILVAIAPQAYVSRNYSQFTVILRGLASAGNVEQATNLAERFNSREEGIASVMGHLAAQGQTQALLDLAYGEGLSSQDMLNNVYASALLGMQGETADALESNFHIDTAATYDAALQRAAVRNSLEIIRFLEGRHTYEWGGYADAVVTAIGHEHMEASVYLMNVMLEKFPERSVNTLLRLFEDSRLMETKPRFAFEFVQQINLPDYVKPRMTDFFTGTMDDALRVRWGIQAAPQDGVAQDITTQGATPEDVPEGVQEDATQGENAQDAATPTQTPAQTLRSGGVAPVPTP